MAFARFARITGTVIIAALLCAALLSGLILATHQLTMQSRQASDFLPANTTVILLHRPNTETIKRWSSLFPNLGSFDVDTVPLALAVVETPQGNATIAFGQRDTRWPDWLSKNAVVIEKPPYSVLIVGGDENLLTDHANSLTLLRAYDTLGAPRQQERPWTYAAVNNSQLTEKIASSTMLTALLKDVTHAGISHGPDGIDAHLLAGAPLRVHEIPLEYASYVSNAIVNIVGTDLDELIRNRITYQSDLSTPAARAMARSYISSVVGEDVSITYDLPVLLQGTSMLEIGFNDSGALVFALAGNSKNTDKTEALFDEMHAGIRNERRGTSVRTMQLDDRFSSTDIVISPIDRSSDQLTEGEWNVTLTDDDDGVLVTAINGKRFLVSNDERALERLKQPAVLTLPTYDSVVLSAPTLGGSINMGKLDEALVALFGITPSDDESNAMLPEEGIYVWSLSAGSKMRHLRVEKRY